MKKRLSFQLAAAVGLLLVLAPPAAAGAADDASMQSRVDAVIASNPGGVQTSWNEITWDGGAAVLTLVPEGQAMARSAVAGCASGSFCVYSLGNYLGNKLSFSTCTSSHNVSALGGPVRSMANSRSSGNIRAYAGPTLLATATAGTGKNVTGTATHINCS